MCRGGKWRGGGGGTKHQSVLSACGDAEPVRKKLVQGNLLLDFFVLNLFTLYFLSLYEKQKKARKKKHLSPRFLDTHQRFRFYKINKLSETKPPFSVSGKGAAGN